MSKLGEEFDAMAKRVCDAWHKAEDEDNQKEIKVAEQKVYRVPVEENEQGDAMITLPEEILKELDIKEGDALVWNVQSNGSIVLTKKK